MFKVHPQLKDNLTITLYKLATESARECMSENRQYLCKILHDNFGLLFVTRCHSCLAFAKFLHVLCVDIAKHIG